LDPLLFQKDEVPESKYFRVFRNPGLYPLLVIFGMSFKKDAFWLEISGHVSVAPP
jgi:hypothetical protein